MAARKTAAALGQLSTFGLGSASTTPWFGSRPGLCVHKWLSRSPAPPRRFSEPVDRLQRFRPGPPSPIRPEPTRGWSQTDRSVHSSTSDSPGS